MTATSEVAPVEDKEMAEKKLTQNQMNDIIRRHFKELSIEYNMRIHLLWDNKFRVNFHNVSADRTIAKSFFVTVSPDGIETDGD